MADQSHLDMLQQGVVAWNSWRERSPSIEPDLSDADLSGADLHEANLLGANLFRADLSTAPFIITAPECGSHSERRIPSRLGHSRLPMLDPSPRSEPPW